MTEASELLLYIFAFPIISSLSALRMRFSLSLRPVTPIPKARLAFIQTPEAACFRGSTHIANLTKSFSSIAPNFLLQSSKLGTVHLWSFGGVESGYQEEGKT